MRRLALVVGALVLVVVVVVLVFVLWVSLNTHTRVPGVL
jgi:hypothetical protein